MRMLKSASMWMTTLPPARPIVASAARPLAHSQYGRHTPDPVTEEVSISFEEENVPPVTAARRPAANNAAATKAPIRPAARPVEDEVEVSFEEKEVQRPPPRAAAGRAPPKPAEDEVEISFEDDDAPAPSARPNEPANRTPVPSSGSMRPLQLPPSRSPAVVEEIEDEIEEEEEIQTVRTKAWPPLLPLLFPPPPLLLQRKQQQKHQRRERKRELLG